MSFYTIVETNEQIENLENLTLKDQFKFFYALFFKRNAVDRQHLLAKNICILFCDKNVIHCGNEQNINSAWGWEKLPYADFVKKISS